MTTTAHTPSPKPSDRLQPTMKRLLVLLDEHRFATTRQLARFTHHHYATPASALRQTSRHLKKLAAEGLVSALERRVGGWQAGSAPGIWTLTTTGARQVETAPARRRPKALSTTFIDHHLAITETRLTFEETAQRLGWQLTHLQLEPECWRSYLDGYSSLATLRPDAFVEVTTEAFTDSYFLEVDRATENPARVIRKCQQYTQYQSLGTEQQHTGVFPAVLWIVPTDYRRLQLQRHLRAEPDLPAGLFTVTTIAELPQVIEHGPATTPAQEPQPD
jgi:DNA-binding transcriptional ArsR family regulator